MQVMDANSLLENKLMISTTSFYTFTTTTTMTSSVTTKTLVQSKSTSPTIAPITKFVTTSTATTTVPASTAVPNTAFTTTTNPNTTTVLQTANHASTDVPNTVFTTTTINPNTTTVIQTANPASTAVPTTIITTTTQTTTAVIQTANPTSTAVPTTVFTTTTYPPTTTVIQTANPASTDVPPTVFTTKTNPTTTTVIQTSNPTSTAVPTKVFTTTTNSPTTTLIQTANPPSTFSSSDMFKDCKELKLNGYNNDGVYSIYPYLPITTPVRVYCDMSTNDGGWTVFQHRRDGSLDFYLLWDDYKKGFGEPNGEYWLGNDHLHQLTSLGTSDFYVRLEKFTGGWAFAKYNNFSVADESDGYRMKLKVGSYQGNVGDSIESHGTTNTNGHKFSTSDIDNDFAPASCAVARKGAWWHNVCTWANLNGLFGNGSCLVNGNCNFWYSLTNSFSGVKTSFMMVRRV